jgi:hypothetical protein
MGALNANLQVTAGQLPAGVCYDHDENARLQAYAERLIVALTAEFATFQYGGVAPSSDLGPWFNTEENAWWVWDNTIAAYRDMVNPVTTSTPDRIVMTDALGKISDTFLNNPISILTAELAATIATSATYATLCAVASTITTGTVIPIGFAHIQEVGGSSAQPCGIQIWNGTTSLGATAVDVTTGGGAGRITDWPLCCFGKPDTSPAGKTFSLRGIATNTNSQWVKSGTSVDDADVLLSNATQLLLIQIGV